jgi:hypothetical protein
LLNAFNSHALCCAVLCRAWFMPCRSRGHC